MTQQARDWVLSRYEPGGGLHQPDIGGYTKPVVVGTKGGTVVLKPVVVPTPTPSSIMEVFPTSIVPPTVKHPTALLVGSEQHGGKGMPWTNGPASIVNETRAIGSLLVCLGSTVAVSMAIGDNAGLLNQMRVNYHNRRVTLKIHTGIGGMERSGETGGTASPKALVPYGRPEPPAKSGGDLPPYPKTGAPGEVVPGEIDNWGPFLGVPFLPKGPSWGQIEESFKTLEEYGIEWWNWMS